jgi:hypothetical protein
MTRETAAQNFEDHCWSDVVDTDTIEIYQAYQRKTYVGDNPAVLAWVFMLRCWLSIWKQCPDVLADPVRT